MPENRIPPPDSRRGPLHANLPTNAHQASSVRDRIIGIPFGLGVLHGLVLP
jgi:hypothetical protein